MWLRDYLYISLGGNRKGRLRTYFNLLVTMVLGGLWHGAAIRFVLWGTLHGVALALHKLWLSVVPGAKVSGYQMHPLSRLAGILVTFHLVHHGAAVEIERQEERVVEGVERNHRRIRIGSR